MKKFSLIILSILAGCSISLVAFAANALPSGKTFTDSNFIIHKMGTYQLVATTPPIGEGAFLCSTSIKAINNNEPTDYITSKILFSPSTTPISFCHLYKDKITIPAAPISSIYFGSSCVNGGFKSKVYSTLTITFNAKNFNNIDTVGINCITMGNTRLTWSGPSTS